LADYFNKMSGISIRSVTRPNNIHLNTLIVRYSSEKENARKVQIVHTKTADMDVYAIHLYIHRDLQKYCVRCAVVTADIFCH